MNQYDNFTDEEIEQELLNTNAALSDEAARIRSVTLKFTTGLVLLLLVGIFFGQFAIGLGKIFGFLLVILAIAAELKTLESDSQKSMYYWSLFSQRNDLLNQKKYRNSKKPR